jgi:hypothetical protein
MNIGKTDGMATFSYDGKCYNNPKANKDYLDVTKAEQRPTDLRLCSKGYPLFSLLLNIL